MHTSNKIRRLAAVAIVAAVGLVLTGCNALTTAEENTGEFQLASYISDRVDSGKPLRIAISFNNTSISFATPIKSGIADAATDLKVDANMVGPSDGDTAKQVSQIQTLIEQKAIDGLAVASGSPDALKPVIDQAFNAGIPVIAFNSGNPGSKQMAFVGQDLVASGVAAGDELLSLLGDKTSGKIVVFSGDGGGGWSIDRFTGFKSAFDGTDFEITDQVTTGFEPNQAYNVVESTMAGAGDVVAIQSMDCCSFTAAGKWVEQNSKVGSILIGGYDYSQTIHDYIADGLLTFTVGQNPYDQGYQSVKILVDFLRDGTPIADYLTDVQLITKDNLDDARIEG